MEIFFSAVSFLRCSVLCLCIAYFFTSSSSVKAQNVATRKLWKEEILITSLLEGYVKETRPVMNSNDAVSVFVKFTFVRVEGLDEATDSFTSSMFIVQMWHDPRLRWNKSEYGGIKTVRLPAKKLWIPDLVLYNVAHQDPHESLYEEMVTVTPDGGVVWVPTLRLSSTCPMDLTDFPYDVQTCPMVFGSWMHTAWEMNVSFISTTKSEMDVVLNEEDSAFLVHPHPQWELVENRARAKLSMKVYDCCPEPFTRITITVKLKRKPQFYRYLTIAPAVILGLLVSMIYLVPARGHDKTIFGLLLLICMTILMTIVQQAIPLNHGSLPKICSFYLGTMILTCISIVSSIIVSNVSVRGTRRRPLPSWIHSIFLGRYGLRRILCIGDYGPLQNLYASELQPTVLAPNPPVISEDGLREMEGEELLIQSSLDNNSDGNMPGGNNGVGASLVDKSTAANVAAIHRCVKFITGKMAADAAYRNVDQDWEELGRVIDRCLFIAFFILFIFTSSLLL